MELNYKDIAKYWEGQRPDRSGRFTWGAIATAIDKQIAYKPIRQGKDFVCPRCEIQINELMNSPYIFCSKCGQAINKN